MTDRHGRQKEQFVLLLATVKHLEAKRRVFHCYQQVDTTLMAKSGHLVTFTYAIDRQRQN